MNAWQTMFAKVLACDACHGETVADEVCAECGGKGTKRVSEVVDLVGVQLTPEWATGPTWPVVQPAAPITVRHRAGKALRAQGRRTILLPDPQIGFWLHDDGMTPMHDEAAMDVALCLIDMVRPHVIGNLGDFIDGSELSSKFVVYQEFVKSTQPALNRGHRFLGEQQAAAGSELGEQWLMEGNHDDRLMLAIARNALAALRLRRADQLQDWPVLSIPNLLALDKLGVDYVGGYPAGRRKVASKHGRQTSLWALHGEKIDMQKVARTERVSTVQGHAHHVSMHSETYDLYEGEDDGSPTGALEVESHSIGCLCRVDGRVPSTRGKPDGKGRPVQRNESWQQAVAVVTEDEDGWDMEVVRIRNGRARYRDRTVSARVPEGM